MKVADPDFVSGRKGRFQLQPPIVHPPFCVCAVCPKHRQRAAGESGRPVDEIWSLPLVIRTRRASPSPTSRVESAHAALQIKQEEEARLAADVKAAEEERRARQNARSFGDIADAYRRYLISERKRYDSARSLIDNIEGLVGRARDANAIDIAVYRELLAEVAEMSPGTRRHYASTLLAMMNNAKSEGIIASHQLSDVRRPAAPKTGRPVTWTQYELGVLTGPALDEFEREQGRWNERVGKVEGTGTLRSASHVPLRGLMLVAYFTLMRPRNNRALTWEEVTLDPVTRTGFFKLDQHKNVNKGIHAEGPIAQPLAEYLLAIRPRNARGLIHPNPATGKPYVEIRKQWNRLVAIASRMLGYELTGRKADFFTFRHTGATDMASKARDGSDILDVVYMMGDTNIRTVEKHYFNFRRTRTAAMITGWELPHVELQPVAPVMAA
jgi:integrase